MLAHAVSLVDLIPEAIPMLGLIDDVLLIPAGATVAVRMTPDALWQERLVAAQTQAESLPRIGWGTLVNVGVWLALLDGFVWWRLA